MKNVSKFFATALLGSLLAAAPVFAVKDRTKTDKIKVAESSVRMQLKAALSDVTSTNSGSVAVYFDITSKGSFELVEVKGANPNLNSDVVKVLKSHAIRTSKTMAGKYSVNIDFVNNESVTSSLSPKDELRNQLASILSSVKAEEGTVNIVFLVKDGSFELKKVNGTGDLALAVEKKLTLSNVTVPSELSGYYQLDLRF
jgi:hypothetical protein